VSIYGRPIPRESWRKFKLVSWAGNAFTPATLEYLRWFEPPIIVDRTDLLDSIPKPRRFPLVVNRLVGMTQLTKALMDRGSGLNLMSLDTFEGLGMTQD
jgi:hypothetical protein